MTAPSASPGPAAARPGPTVACLGDILLDVIVEAAEGLVVDDDAPATITFAAGGQAANVAAWVSALGGRARLFGPRAATGNGRLIEEALEALGVELHGPVTSRLGTVMSLVTDGYRSMASDPGSTDWLEQIGPGAWLDGADWLFVSGFSLMRSPAPERFLEVADAARDQGTRVAVDLASAAMIEDYGPARFRALWRALRPAAVFANDHEWTATNAGSASPTPGTAPGTAAATAPASFGAGGTCVLALKHGARGCTFVIDGVADDRAVVPGPVVDATGAGDSLAAGYLVGGVELAMTTAARCVARIGAQPTSPGLLLEETT